MFGREKAGKRQAGTAGCRGRSASWREGRTSHKIKNWGWRVIDLPAPSAVCFTQTKGFSDFAMMTCIALGYFYRTGDMLPETASAKSRVASFLWLRLMRISLPSMRWKVSPTREKILGVFTQKLWWQRIKACRSRVDRSSSGVCRQRTVSWSLTTFV